MDVEEINLKIIMHQLFALEAWAFGSNTEPYNI